MKRSNNLSLILVLIISFFSFGCNDPTNDTSDIKAINTRIDISNRAEPLSISDISGNWRGSYTDKDYGFRLAIKLAINQDGTYTNLFFSEGDQIDSTSGTVETFIEKEDKTDNYGENKVTTYLHGIRLHFNTQWGSRTEVYRINQNFNLVPVISFTDSGHDIILTKELY